MYMLLFCEQKDRACSPIKPMDFWIWEKTFWIYMNKYPDLDWIWWIYIDHGILLPPRCCYALSQLCIFCPHWILNGIVGAASVANKWSASELPPFLLLAGSKLPPIETSWIPPGWIKTSWIPPGWIETSWIPPNWIGTSWIPPGKIEPARFLLAWSRLAGFLLGQGWF